MLALVVLLFAAVAVGAVSYVYVGQQLPPAEELWGRQTKWVSSRIYDRNGQLLWELLDPQGGRGPRKFRDLFHKTGDHEMGHSRDQKPDQVRRVKPGCILKSHKNLHFIFSILGRDGNTGRFQYSRVSQDLTLHFKA